LNIIKYVFVNYTYNPAFKDGLFIGRLPESFNQYEVRIVCIYDRAAQ